MGLRVSGFGFRVWVSGFPSGEGRWGGTHFTGMCYGTEAGSYLRLIDSCIITQLKAQGPSRTFNESKEEDALDLVAAGLLGVLAAVPAPGVVPGDSNSHGARPVHLIITMIKWIRTSRLSGGEGRT